MSNTKPVGRALLFEHLPFVRFRGSGQGVLFVIFANGDAFFYPLNEQTKGDTVSGNKMPLTKDQTSKKKSGAANLEQYNPNKNTPSTSELASNTKPFAFDITLSLSPDLYRVFSFNFGVEEATDNARAPRKVLLSPDKQLLMIIGVLYREPSSLPLPPQATINGQTATTTTTATTKSTNGTHATPDPASLKSPPLATAPATTTTSRPPPNTISATNSTQTGSTTHNPSYIPPLPPWAKRFIATEPRKIGPVLVLGPAVGPFGQSLKMTHISNNSFHPYPHPPPSCSNYDSTSGTPPFPPAFQYVTWNDDGYGEYCLWTVTKGKKDGSGKGEKGSAGFIYHPRQLVTSNSTSPDDEAPPSMRCQILSMAFAPAHPHRLLACLRRHGHPRAAANGFGIHMIDTAVSGIPIQPGGNSAAAKGREVWYQVCAEGAAEIADVVCCKWSETMLLGTVPSIAVVVKGKGLFELVDHHCASAFQVLHEEFVNTISNFVQVGRYHRYWLNWNGKLRVIIVTPQTESPHPEWIDLFTQTHESKHYLLEMRMLGSRVGYFVNDLRLDPQADLSEPTKKKSGSSTTNSTTAPTRPPLPPPSSGNTDVLMGLHLYRCFQCKQTLLRPLACGRCMGAAYCSKKCQLLHMEAHKIDCIVPHLPSPYLPFHSHTLPSSQQQRPSSSSASASAFPLPPNYSGYPPQMYVPPSAPPNSSSAIPLPGPTPPPTTGGASSQAPPSATHLHQHQHTHTHTHAHTCSHPSHSHTSPTASVSSHK